MPAPLALNRVDLGDEVVISWGGKALFVYGRSDRALRNLALVTLGNAGVRGVELAELFGVRPEWVSRLRREAREHGSAGLVAPMGRPRRLDAAGVAKVYRLADEGVPGVRIAEAMGVSGATISRLLSRRPHSKPERLGFDDAGTDGDYTDGDCTDGDCTDGDDGEGDDGGIEGEEEGCDGEGDDGGVEGGGGLGRIGSGEVDCLYAGAMLLHGFLDRVASGVLEAIPSGSARRYDAAGLVGAACFGFALGSSSAEGTKHLCATDAGALIGTDRFPHLRTLRPRLAALAETVDPIELQGALAKAMLADTEPVPTMFYVDDHFVAYSGAYPVPKGWNTRRRLAEAGRDDTLIVDASWRAICFATSAPSGLSKTMIDPLEQLQQICPDNKITIAFDRGGSYPKTFAELNKRGFDWVSYRRAPLAASVGPPRACQLERSGRTETVMVADETITLEAVGAVRQLSLYDNNGRCYLQILTSKRHTSPQQLIGDLRHRWCIENSFKYLEDHHGIHWLCDYRVTITTNTAKIPNPARSSARAALTQAQAALTAIEHQLTTTATTPITTTDLAATNNRLAELTTKLETAKQQAADAKLALQHIPAKLPANTIDPDALTAQQATSRRCMQMVCRLLAYNAELDLATTLNTYLDDPDEYRAITRHLLHQPGHISFHPDHITVTIRRPDAPRIATALNSLTHQLNTNPPHLLGDHRPITYHLTPKP